MPVTVDETVGPDLAAVPYMGTVARVSSMLPGALVVVPTARPGRRVAAALIIVTLFGSLVSAAVWVHRLATHRAAPAPLRPPTPLAAMSNLRPVAITLTTPEWTKVRETVTVDQLHSDHRLWRQMHFGDWDRVDPAYRESALRAMVRSYESLFRGPVNWRDMTTEDWDKVPQPVRSMAYLRMIWRWARVERVGAEFGLLPEHVAQAIGAIVMTESWFEHRAFNQNQWGNRDLGLAQCSDYCREEIAAMVARCELLFRPTEADYFNPWMATRIAAVWFRRELELAEGDVDLAIRAYHRGIRNATDEKGDQYLARVHQLRDRYIRAQGHSGAWSFLVREIGGL